MYNDTITLFNFHDTTKEWYPTVISRVDVGSPLSSKPTTQGIINEDTVSIIIKTNRCKQVNSRCGMRKDYIGPKEFARCDKPYEHFTFNDTKDFIYCGKWDGAGVIADESYESGFYNYMNKNYDGVYKITSSVFYGLLPHFEIGGR